MKIGILSLVLHSNYGGILQSYALQTVIQRMGHNIVVFNRDRRIQASAYDHLKSLLSVVLRNYILKSGVRVKSYWQLEKERKLVEQNTSAFIGKYIKTRMLQKLDADSLEDINAVVVGSDQVWRGKYFKKFWRTGIEDAFLKFAEDSPIKRIAYAASFGTDEWEYSEEETKQCARLLGKFDAVSVREASAVKMCDEKLGYGGACHVLDPTLLLSRGDYEHLVEESSAPMSKGDLMCYILDKTGEKKHLIERIAQERNLSPFSTKALKGSVQPPVEQWIRGFMDAKFVVTDSFHACVFSLIFRKPFVVFGNIERGLSRFNSLLDMFSLRDHLITSINDYRSDYMYSIPDDAYAKLESYKKMSLEFLYKNLS